MKTNRNHFNSRQGLYDPSYEHDACGVGMLVNIHGEKSHDIIESALKVLENMRHRGAEGADNKTGDGAGILLQIPHELILLQGIPVRERQIWHRTNLSPQRRGTASKHPQYPHRGDRERGINLDALTQSSRSYGNLGKGRTSDRTRYQADINHRLQRSARAGTKAIPHT